MGVDLYTLWKPTVEKICKKTARDFPEVTYEDLYQDLFLWILETPQLKHPSRRETVKVIERQARHMAWEIRAGFQYQYDRYLYRPSDVREILKTSFDTSHWQVGFVPEDAWSDAEDQLIVHADVSWGYSFLPDNYKKILFRKYVLHDEYEHNSAEHKMFYRAIDRLVFVLNVYRRPQHAGPGARRAISNAQAQWLVEGDN